MSTDLRDAVAVAIASHEWDDFPRSAHADHNYYGACAICQGDITRIAEVALAALAERSGDLPKRMRAALEDLLRRNGWDGERNEQIEREMAEILDTFLSVRYEHAAHLAARAAKAEARVEHAEAGAQLSSERLAKVRTELDRLWSPAPDSAGRHAVHCEWGATSGAYCSCVGFAEIARLRAERDALKAVWSEWRERLGGSFPRAMVQEMTSALDTETTTTPARERV